MMSLLRCSKYETRSDSPTLSKIEPSSPSLNYKASSSTGQLAQNNQKTPVYAIPTEVLSAIFEICKSVEDQDFEEYLSGAIDEPPDTAHIVPFEILISHVSMHFRHVAIGTHRMWTSVRVAPKWRPERVKTYIIRSGNHGLDLNINSADEVGTDSKVPNETINTVIAQSTRWRQLELSSIHENTDFPFFNQLHDIDVPFLVHLSISVDYIQHLRQVSLSKGVDRPGIFIQGAPKLSFLRLRGLAVNFLRPPLASLTTLHLDQTRNLPLEFSLLRGMLMLSPMLENLSIYGDIINDQSWLSETQAITLPSLRSLRICGIGGHIYSGMLLCIDAPLLEYLMLKGVYQEDLDRFLHFSSIPKFPCLHNLTFCDFDLSYMKYEIIFRSFPGIKNFAFLHSPTSTPLLKLLSEKNPNKSRPIVWPQLQVLTFMVDIGLDDHNIGEMAEKRSSAGYPLVELRLVTMNKEELLLGWQEAGFTTRIVIPKYLEVTRWPTYRVYADPCDVLFS